MDSTPVDILIGSDGPEHLEGRVIQLPLPCKRCRYNLQGLPALAACPECGVSASRSLEAVIDPTTHKLPPLLSPSTVGDALMMLSGLCLAGGFAFTLHMVFHLPWVSGDLPGLANRLDRFGLLLSAICGLVAWLPLLKMWPSPSGMKGFDGRRGILIGGFGLVLWIGGCVLAWLIHGDGSFGPDPINLVAILGGALFLLGFRAIVVVVGLRSRVFRTDQIRRQRIRDLIIGLGFVALGIVMGWIGDSVMASKSVSWLALGKFTVSGNAISGMAFVGIAMSVVAGFLLLVGLVYLCFNMSWVRRALKSPPRRLREYLSEAV